MDENIDYEVFVDCTPLHNDVGWDPILEKLQAALQAAAAQNQQPPAFTEAETDSPVEAQAPPVEAQAPEQPPPEVAAPQQPRRRPRVEWHGLPEGWIEFHVRRTRGRSAGLIDKYYVELSTGKMCRSRREVVEYITEQQASRMMNQVPIQMQFQNS